MSEEHDLTLISIISSNQMNRIVEYMYVYILLYSPNVMLCFVRYDDMYVKARWH